MNEEWRAVKGYEGLYEVSNTGKVRSLNYKGKTGYVREMCLKKHPDGYRQVQISRQGFNETICVHRLVAEAFLPNQRGLPQINHIDYDKTNNNVTNLEWCDPSRNTKHSWENPTRKRAYRAEKIAQYALDGRLIAIWENCISVKNELGYHQTSIWECCEGKRHTAYGFIWRYAS